MNLFTGPSAYRDADSALRSRRDALCAKRRAQLAALAPEAREVYERRVARVAAGLFAMLAGLQLAVLAIFHYSPMFGPPPRLPATVLLVLCGVGSAVVYLVARLLARVHIERVLSRTAAPSPDVLRDLDRLERIDPVRVLAERSRGLERWSAALPMGGVALLAPLGLHLCVWACFQSIVKAHLYEFDSWIALSYLLVGHCHLVLVCLCFRHGFILRTSRTHELVRRASDGWPALGWTVVSSLIPGVFLLFVPTLLVGATGLVIVPAMFGLVSRRLCAERLALGE